MKRIVQLAALLIFVASFAGAQTGTTHKNGATYLTDPSDSLKLGTHTLIDPRGWIKKNPSIDSIRARMGTEAARDSNRVPVLDGANIFKGNQTISNGTLGATGLSASGALTILGNTSLQATAVGTVTGNGAITATGQPLIIGAITATTLNTSGAVTVGSLNVVGATNLGTVTFTTIGAHTVTGPITAAGQALTIGSVTSSGTVSAPNIDNLRAHADTIGLNTKSIDSLRVRADTISRNTRSIDSLRVRADTIARNTRSIDSLRVRADTIGRNTKSIDSLRARLNNIGVSRVLYVDGGFIGLAPPYFTSASTVMTYISGMTPAADLAHPVQIKSFSKTDGTPIDWSSYDFVTLRASGIYVLLINDLAPGSIQLLAGNPNTLNVVGTIGQEIYDTDAHVKYIHNGTDWRSKDGFRLGQIGKLRVLLSQASTTAPYADQTFENSTGATVTYGYTSTGLYTITFSSTVLVIGQSHVFPRDNIDLAAKQSIQTNIYSRSVVQIRTKTWTSDITSLSNANDVLSDQFVIEVWIEPAS